ncbi:tetratricopeptide repeat protein [Anaerohalosphaera lusitana]|uniref:Tetratricopeptide repeat protein n=1 Tax=Anaerohalosphaera lusitana TaxID=1936003 RepID=A0A1U9NLK9_9BACT|nr:tetratricopeptide repeat protein [Anaerohalosphaera lusitana]AQT68799.1 tetratricopeptide repeat protein [Anaerohalosphaera lusitana]
MFTGGKDNAMKNSADTQMHKTRTILFALLALAAMLTTNMQAAEQPVRIEPRSGQTNLTGEQLAMWNDPDFQKQFTQSYIAETEIEPRVTVDERDDMQEVLELISDDKLDGAVELLRKNRNEAASAVFDFTLANIYFQQEKLDQAAEVYNVAVDKYPKFRRAWKNLGLIYVRQSSFAPAVECLTRVISLGGGDATSYGLLGFAYSSLDKSIPAESAYRMAILLDSETLDWKMGLARSFFKQERYGEAVALLGQLIKDQPENKDLWLLQANAYVGMGKPLESAEILEFVDHLGQSTAESLFMLGDIYINEQLYEIAADSYMRAMDKNPDQNVERSLRCAKILAARAAYDQTQLLVSNIESTYENQLSDEQKKNLLKIRSRLAVAKGSADEEAKVLEKIVELDPLDGEALILLGQHYGRKGDTEQAIFYFERAAGIDEYEADAKIRHAQLLVRNGHYAKALPLLRSAQRIEPRENVQEYLEQVERVAKR